MDDIYIKCSCHGEGVYINYEKEDKLYYLSFFSLGYKTGKLSFWNRLRWISHILVNGRPYDDQVVLDQAEAKKISEFIRTNGITL